MVTATDIETQALGLLDNKDRRVIVVGAGQDASAIVRLLTQQLTAAGHSVSIVDCPTDARYRFIVDYGPSCEFDLKKLRECCDSGHKPNSDYWQKFSGAFGTKRKKR